MDESAEPKLPEFTADGLLPAGDYALTIEALRRSPLVLGPADTDRYPGWDSRWRGELVDRFEVLCHQLWNVGISRIFIDGSFAEDKEHPNDIDGYFECDLRYLANGQLQRDLNLQEPDKIWTWDPASRQPYRGYPKRQLPMWHKYRVELYPEYGQLSGIRDEHGNELEFPAAFRKTRAGGKPKGIIRIRKEASP